MIDGRVLSDEEIDLHMALDKVREIGDKMQEIVDRNVKYETEIDKFHALTHLVESLNMEFVSEQELIERAE